MSKNHSEWTSFLNKSYKDPYFIYKENILNKCESMISEITKELIDSNQGYDSQTAKEVAVSLVMQQMLDIQHQNSPETQKAMVINLFCDLPNIKDFRKKLVEKSSEKTSLKAILANKVLLLYKKFKPVIK